MLKGNTDENRSIKLAETGRPNRVNHHNELAQNREHREIK